MLWHFDRICPCPMFKIEIGEKIRSYCLGSPKERSIEGYIGRQAIF